MLFALSSRVFGAYSNFIFIDLKSSLISKGKVILVLLLSTVIFPHYVK